MSGQDIDIDDLLLDQVPEYWDQATRIARNPVLSAQFFDLSMQGFFDSILNYTHDHNPDELGALGLTKGYFGCVEAQGRGTLHCHLFVWLEGGLNPEQIKERVMDVDFRTRLCDYIDDTIKSAVPALPTLETVYPLQKCHPCAIRGPTITDESTFMDSVPARTDLHYLANSCQRHVHAATCYKYWKGLHEKKECRFNLDPSLYVEKTTLDPENGEFEFRVSDGMVNNFCETILMAMRCNIDIKFIGSGQSAKAVLYYITDYITKSQLKAHNSYAALKTAVIKLRALDDADDQSSFEYKARQLLVKCANSLISKQELSAAQVSAYLMGIGDHYTSHSFRTLYLFAFEAYVKDHMPQGHGNSNTVPEVQCSRRSEDENPDVSDNESDTGDDLDEEELAQPSYDDVLIAPAGNGNVRAVQNDVTDYLLRSHSDDQIDLWHFMSMYDKIPIARDKQPDTDNTRPTRGRPFNPRSRFLPSHPDFETHTLRRRSLDNYYIPVLTSAVPNSDALSNKEKHALMMLILFKPWRSVEDLLELHSSWSDAYTSYLTCIEPESLQVIQNMQLLNQCKDARDKDFATKGAKRRNLLRSLDSSRGERVITDESLDVFLDNDDQMLQRLADINRSQSKALSKDELDQQSALTALTDAGLYTLDDDECMTLDNEESFDYDSLEHATHQPIADNCNLEAIWRDTYAKRRAQYKQTLKTTQQPIPSMPTDTPYSHGNPHPTDSHMSITSIAHAHGESSASLSIGTHGAMPLTIEAKKVIISEVCTEFTLNEEQERAYRIVANHAIEPSQCCPLSVFLSGPGGTGKSRVIDAITTLFLRFNEVRRFRLASYTGVAAKNIKGMTLHTLLNMRQLFNDKDKTENSPAKKELFEMWAGVEYLLIDEVSMVGCELMTQISAALSIAKCNPVPFGGISVIFAGDFCQLPPVKNTRLYTPIEDNSLISASQNEYAQMKLMGRSAWLATDTVVVFHQQMRQKGQLNSRFRELLDRLRFGKCNEDDVNLLKTRVMSTADVDLTSNAWRSAPIITKRNSLKDALNIQGAETFAARTRKPIHYYHARDFRRSKPVDAKLQEQLLTYNTGVTSQAMGRLPLVEGMPVMFSQNYDVAGGVVNGSIGILKSVRYTVDENGTRFAQSCVVEIPDLTCEPMDGLNTNEVVALVEEFDVKITDWRTGEKTTFKRKQLPIQPAFAMTDYKAQGRTLKNVIMDLATCTGSQSPYVMVSRATSLEGILILRDFHPKRVQCNLSQDLRNELQRIDKLHVLCKRRFERHEHFCRASPDHPIQSDLLKKIAPKGLRDSATAFKQANIESRASLDIDTGAGEVSPVRAFVSVYPTHGFPQPQTELDERRADKNYPAETFTAARPIAEKMMAGPFIRPDLRPTFLSETTPFPLTRSSFVVSSFGPVLASSPSKVSQAAPLPSPDQSRIHRQIFDNSSDFRSFPDSQITPNNLSFPGSINNLAHSLSTTTTHIPGLSIQNAKSFDTDSAQTSTNWTMSSRPRLPTSCSSITIDPDPTSPSSPYCRSLSSDYTSPSLRPPKKPRLQ